MFFPARPLPSGADRDHACPFSAPGWATDGPAGDPGDDEGPEHDAPGGISLGLVARLAAAPSRTIADLARKAEVLVARLASEDGVDAGLCAAEAALLRSVLRDLRAIADDLGFVACGAGLLVPAAAK